MVAVAVERSRAGSPNAPTPRSYASGPRRVRIHHLNCGTCCPAGGRLFDGTSDGPLARIVCHCLLVESDDGLVLVDTGFGTRDIGRPHRRLSEFFLRLNNIQLRPEETALAQVRALGFDPGEIRHILVTHLDFDHAGGLEDFPNARVHVLAREKEAADECRGGAFVGTRRYRPGQWDAVTDWRLYPMGGGEPWFGFDAVRQLEGLPPEILLVPLVGHTWGHTGIAIYAATRGTGCCTPGTPTSITVRSARASTTAHRCCAAISA